MKVFLKYIIIFTLFVIESPMANAAYCTANGGGDYEWINTINIDGFTKTSGAQGSDNDLKGYSDFTNLTIPLTNGITTLTPGFSNNSYTQHWAIWIDINKNSIFEPDEKVLDNLSGKASVSSNLSIPDVSAQTNTRMRVVMKYDNPPSNPCGDVGSGEVEDFTVLIAPKNEPVPDPDKNIPNSCKTESNYTAREITGGDTICLTDIGPNYFSLRQSNSYNSLAISTAHGSGNLSLYAKNGGWPDTNGSDPASENSGNVECIIIKNPSDYWTYIKVTGSKSKASLVVDLGATSCRGNPKPDPDPLPGNNGYQYDYVNVLIYRFAFSDTPFTWDTIADDMAKVNDYYKEQSYGRFTVTYELKPVIYLDEPKTKYDNNFHAWVKLWKQKVKETGVDPDSPGEGNIVMMTAEQVGNFNSTAAPPLMSIYHHSSGVVAHEIGHATGLRHAKAVEAGPGKTIGTGNKETESLNYGNVYSMMGMGAHSLQEYNLMYKSYFGWVKDNEVPLVNSSGVYRIYAFDHGTRAGTNAPGNIGIRLKSGNGKYTYWLEYRTTHSRYVNTKNGVLLNLQGYMEDEKNSSFWKHTSHLLDMTPGSKTPGWWGDDQTDSELVIGKSYTDHWNAFRITVVAKGGNEDTATAWIEVKIDML